jgi:hypothetical protein
VHEFNEEPPCGMWIRQNPVVGNSTVLHRGSWSLTSDSSKRPAHLPMLAQFGSSRLNRSKTVLTSKIAFVAAALVLCTPLYAAAQSSSVGSGGAGVGAATGNVGSIGLGGSFGRGALGIGSVTGGSGSSSALVSSGSQLAGASSATRSTRSIFSNPIGIGKTVPAAAPAETAQINRAAGIGSTTAATTSP